MCVCVCAFWGNYSYRLHCAALAARACMYIHEIYDTHLNIFAYPFVSSSQMRDSFT